MAKKLNGTVIVTYRCNARCSMCNRYKAPSRPEEELTVETIRKLPKMNFVNVTGGEPFIRQDLEDIIRELYTKTERVVISTNGFFTDRILDLCEKFPKLGPAGSHGFAPRSAGPGPVVQLYPDHRHLRSKPRKR